MTMGSSEDGMRDLRVALVVNNPFRMGGAERQCLMLAGELARLGARPMLWSLAGAGPVLEQAARQGVETGAVALRYPLSPWYGPLNLLRAWWFFRRRRPDVIVGYTSVPNLYAGWVWRMTGARAFIWSQRNAGLDRPPAFLERVALRGASAFIANSASGMEFLRAVRGGQSDRAFEIPNGVEIPSVPAAPGRSARVVCLANGRAVKDHKMLLRAWSKVQQEWRGEGDRPGLVLAGAFDEDPAYTAEVRALASASEMAGTVEFAGAVDVVQSLLRDAGIGVLSSQNEGMPNAVLEFMAAGLPVVATDLPGIRQALGAESTRDLVPVGDADALAGRLLELLRNPAVRDERGRRNRARADKEFSAGAMASRTWAVIREALA
jgi:glycosyltransferase involved in cell wall biosynthesis